MRLLRIFSALVVLISALVATGCGGSSHGSPPPSSNRVFLVVEENHSYSEVIGNSGMPYLNSLAAKYGLAMQYYANTHPSIGNYFVLTTGQIETEDDQFSGLISDDNIVRELVKAGKTWRSYAESLPNIGYRGDVFPYEKGHNPFAYFSDVVGTSQANSVVPFSQFSSDLSSRNLPDFSFIVPNVLNDGHDGSLATADQWLQTNLGPLLSSSDFQNNGLLVITFDEGNLTDLSNGGGHVATLVIGPQVKSGYQSTTLYQHESTMRLMLATLGINAFPGNAANAPSMGEFFK